MGDVLLAIVGVCFQLLFLPLTAYMITKAARMGYLMANKRFDEMLKEEESNKTKENVDVNQDET